MTNDQTAEQKPTKTSTIKQRDLDTASKVSLEICGKCGWYNTLNHVERCDPARGQAAHRLICRVPDEPAGQLGYGDNRVVFDLAEDFSVVFARGERAFSFYDLHLLGDLSEDEAADLVHALKSWSDGVLERRKSGTARSHP